VHKFSWTESTMLPHRRVVIRNARMIKFSKHVHISSECLHEYGSD